MRGGRCLPMRERGIAVGLGGLSISVRADSSRERILGRVAELYGRGRKAVEPERKEDGHSRRVRVYSCCLNMSFVGRHGGGGDSSYLCSSNM